MSSKRPYLPIDCSFHDQLLEWATFRTPVTIQYEAIATEEVLTVKGQIADVYTQNKEEFLLLNDGTQIRLDLLIKVNDRVLPAINYCVRD